MTNKLNYDNAAALINAFKQGAKFKIVGNPSGPVTRMEIEGRNVRAYLGFTGSVGSLFRPDGVHSILPNVRLIRDESLGYERTTVTVGDSVFGWIPPARRVVPAAPALPKPLLQRLLTGETFHNPKTRETVESFTFSKNTLLVTLKGEDGKTRTSERYDHNGKHKWRPERSLVAGPVPPKAKPDVQVAVFLFESKNAPGTFRAFTLGETVNYEMWRQVGYGRMTAEGRQRA